jgi:hypothetical protein
LSVLTLLLFYLLNRSIHNTVLIIMWLLPVLLAWSAFSEKEDFTTCLRQWIDILSPSVHARDDIIVSLEWVILVRTGITWATYIWTVKINYYSF